MQRIAVAEGGETEVAFTAGSEAHARCADHAAAVEQSVEELPAILLAGCLHPEVGRVLTAVDTEAELGECLTHDTCILHIVMDGLHDLLVALGGGDGLGSTL